MSHVEFRGTGKHYGGVQALCDIHLTIERGSVHALVGENGAGKSTLGKVLAGIVQPDAGEMRIDGEAVRFRSPRDALARGITAITQEMALLPLRSVVENVFLGIEHGRYGLPDRGGLLERYHLLDDRIGFGIPPAAKVGSLRQAERQKVEVLRALARDAGLIVMDEPTAALTTDESRRLGEIVLDLAAGGTTVVFISHYLPEVLAMAHRVSVLRNGKLVRTSEARDETPESLVEAMLGRSLQRSFPVKEFPPPDSPVVLAVEGLARGAVIRDVSLTVKAGEIVGIAGLVGSGRTELARSLFGAERPTGGRVTIDGAAVDVRSPFHAMRSGIALLPESRKDQGLHMRRSIAENVTLPHLRAVSRMGVVSRGRSARDVMRVIADVDVRSAGPNALVETLSGGNQQKVLFAKWLFRRPRLLIADEPTRGVDVGAKLAIYELLASLARQGMAVLMISSELEEILGMAHRILVMRLGRLAAEFDGRTAREEDVMHAAFGTNPSEGEVA